MTFKPGESAGINRLYLLSNDPQPPDTVCVTLQIPNDLTHILNFMDALATLALWTNYPRDLDHTAKKMADMWSPIWQNAGWTADCGTAPIIQQDEFEVEMSLCEQLRFQDGKLQALCCGKWEDIAGQPTQGIGGGGQPGPSPQPPAGGGCQTYQGDMSGAAPWYLPTVVNSGDTITIENTSGAFYAAYRHEWFCADGESFFIVCSGFKYFDSGSQMPSVPTGKLIAKIGATYYDILGAPFTVPPGIVNAQVQFEMNTPPADGSGGDVAFTVTVCNNQLETWTKVFDFTTNPYSEFFSIEPAEGAVLGPTGEWRPGIGYGSTAPLESPPSVNRGINLTCTATFDLVSLSVPFTFTPGTYDGNTTTPTFIEASQPSGVAHNQVLMPTTPTSPQMVVVNENVTSFVIQILCGHSNANTDPGGDVVWPSLTINGQGPNPFA